MWLKKKLKKRDIGWNYCTKRIISLIHNLIV